MYHGLYNRSIGMFRFLLLVWIGSTILTVLPAQDENEIKELKALCTDIEKECGVKKGKNVEGIVAAIGILQSEYEFAGLTVKKAIEKCLKKALSSRPKKESVPYQRRAAECLGSMGKKGYVILLATLKSRKLMPRDEEDESEWTACLQVKAAVIEGIGACKDAKSVKMLCKLLGEKEPEIIGAAAIALSHYHGLPLSKRRPIVEALVMKYSAIASEGVVTGRLTGRDRRRGGGSSGMHEKLFEVRTPLNRALRKLTGQELSTAKNWMNWWVGHKDDKEWKKGEYKDGGQGDNTGLGIDK